MESIPIPDVFPKGTSFLELDDTPLVIIPGLGWFSGRGNTLSPRPDVFEEIRDNVDFSMHSDIDETEFRRLSAARA